MSYEEWYRKYVGNGTKPLTNGGQGGIISSGAVSGALDPDVAGIFTGKSPQAY